VTVWQDRSLVLGGRGVVLSSYGYLIFFFGTVLMAILVTEAKVALILGSTLVFAALFYRDALRLLQRWQLWAFIVPTLLLSPFVIGQKDVFLWGLSLSREGFWAGVWMAVRGLSIAVAAGVFAGAVSVSQMAQLFERMRLKGLGFALGVATNMLPVVQETIESSYQAIRLRGGFRRHRLETLKLLVVAVIAGSLRRGDDIVCAAEGRAFDPSKSQAPRLHLTPADVTLGGVILLLGVVLLLV